MLCADISCKIDNYFTVLITHFMPLVSSDTYRKHQKTSGFLMFSRFIEKTSGMKWVNAMTRCSLDSFIQKHPSRGVLIKRSSENMQQIYRRTSMTRLQSCKATLLKSHFGMGVFSCKFALYFLNTFP